MGRGEQPGVRRSPRAGRLDRRHAARPRAGALVRPRRLPPRLRRRRSRRFLLDEGAPAAAPARARRPRRDLRDRRRPEPPGHGTRAVPSPPAGSQSLADRGITVGMLFVDGATTRPRSGSTASLGFTTSRTDRAYGLEVGVTTRATAPAAAELEALLAEWGEPRYRADQVWDALYRQHVPLDDATALPRALRERLADGVAARARSDHRRDRARRHDVEVAVVVPTRRRADRDRAHAVSRAGHGVRVVPGRVRDGLHLLRHRPGRLRATPRRRRDRRAGRARRARVAPTGQQRRLHGHGRAARQLRPDLGRGRTHPRRPRALGPPHHRQHRRRRPRHPAPRTRGPSGDARGVAARGHRRRARRAGARSTGATRSPRSSTPRPSSPAPRADG